MNVATALTTLGVSLPQLYALMSNPGFASAVQSNDGAGGIVFVDATVSAFATTLASAKSNGWLWDNSMLATANFAFMAANPTGSFYRGSESYPMGVLD